MTNSTQHNLKSAKQRKGEIARQFKSVVVGSSEHTELLASMRVITDEIKGLELQLAAAVAQPSATAASAPLAAAPVYTIDPGKNWGKPFSMRELTQSEMPQWDAFLRNQERLSVYCQPVWRRLISDIFGHAHGIFAALSAEGDILGGIPLVYFNSRLFGRFAVSLPYFNYGGVIAPWFDVAVALVDGVGQLCGTRDLAHIEVRTLQAGLGVNVNCKKVSMILPLPKSSEHLDERLGAKVRAQYKKALGYSPEFKLGKMELLKDFYQVFAENMRDLGTPVYSKKWFAAILQAPEIDAHLALVYMAGKPVSAGFLVGHNGMLEIPWASTVKSANVKNANMWMYRQILGYAIAQGFCFFDFGRSTKDAGTYKFKKQWGAEPVEHYWYYALPPGGPMPGLNPDNPKFKLVIAVWQRLPVWLTKLIGPAIIRHVP